MSNVHANIYGLIVLYSASVVFNSLMTQPAPHTCTCNTPAEIIHYEQGGRGIRCDRGEAYTLLVWPLPPQPGDTQTSLGAGIM